MKEIKTLFNRRNVLKLLMMIFDMLAVNFAYFLALVLRYYVTREFTPGAIGFVNTFQDMAPYYGVICVAVFYVFRLYNTMWKFGGLRDLNRIFMACIVTSMIQVVGTQIFFERVTLSYYVLGFAIQFVLISGGRFAYRFYLLERNAAEAQRKATTNAMIIGIGGIGRFAWKQIEQDGAMKVVCAVNAEEEGAKQYLDGVPVIGGLKDLSDILEKKKIGYVIIADERLGEEEKRRIKVKCDEMHVEVQDFIEYLQNNNNVETPIAVNSNADNLRVIPFSLLTLQIWK